MTTSNTPQCIGIILDGNRRWAKKKGLPTLIGHRTGLLTTLIESVRTIRDKGIPHLAVYMFSTENWNRSKEEVEYLMDLFREAGRKQLRELAEENIRIRFVGQRTRFAPDLQELIAEVEEVSAHNTALTLWVCLSYGGRAEIVEAAKSIAASGEEVTEESFAQHFWTADMPDPDIIIRTGGEKRLSGFLTWKSVYSELFFVDDYWPAFTETHLDAILEEYAQRERRRGK